jgi:ATP phosphoribosyltransferase regulatory subunit
MVATAETASNFQALEAQAALVMDIFSTAGYERVAPAIIQPADVFLNQIGEVLRSRTYVFNDMDGRELCLRPDLTVPVARLYLERNPDAMTEARYCYNGSAFRFYTNDDSNTAQPAREFRQAGIECFGSDEPEKTEVEILALAIEAIRATGLHDITLRISDFGIFFALVDSLKIPERWKYRLKHHFWRPDSFRKLLAELGEAGSEHLKPKQLLRRLAEAGDEKDAAEAIFHEYLEKNNIEIIGNRSPAEITERLMDKAADINEEPLSEESVRIIRQFLEIDAPPRAAVARIKDLAAQAGVDLRKPLAVYDKRLTLLEKYDIDLKTVQFNASFGRELEYYTGFLFQVEYNYDDKTIPLASGGRYDQLLKHMGSSDIIPAVGCALHTEMLLAASRGDV